MRNLSAIALAGCLLLLAGSANAAEADPAGVSQINAAGTPILLEAGKGTLIRLPRPASTVFVANPEVADVQVKSPSLVYITAKAPGETVIYAVDSNDKLLLNAPVRVEHDLSRLRQSLNALVPGQNIAVNSVDNNVVLSGKVASAGQAERARTFANSVASQTKGQVINELNVATSNQVNVRVRVAEVDRTALKEMGINWSKLTGNFQFNTSANLPASAATPDSIAYSLDLPGNAARLQGTLDALVTEGFATNLAEPNLTTVSGQPASFLAGGEFPVPIPSTSTSGTPTISIEFKQFGVALDMTPTIIDASHINLRVRPEVSQLSTNGEISVPLTSTQVVTIPALTVQRAETSVELGSGESFALAGLIQNNTAQNISKLPWLGDIPMLGALFRSDQFQRNESELVIVITPYLVKPSATALALPTDGYVAPHDVQRVINSDLYRQGLPASPRGAIDSSGTGLIGPAGFRLD
jgi:pilus assembly protein CpaC